MNILIAEPLSPAAAAVLEAEPDFTVIQSTPKDYRAHLAAAEALIVRSAVKVTAEVLNQAPNLRVVGRAGIGTDNIDLGVATERGVLVMNTPGGNAVSVAEHTLALMLAMARSIPQASASTRAGRWEKKRFLGTELRGKTLGVIGLGNIGVAVVRLARPFGMKMLAHDPYVSAQVAADEGVELVPLDDLYRRSDYITLHVSLTAQTHGMLHREAFAKMKEGARIVNCARGELIDAAALEEALASGRVAGAALDVFSPEPPPPDFPLFARDAVIATPHIAGSTEEAQEEIALRIAEQIREYLKNGVVINAVNMPAVSAEEFHRLRPYVQLAKRLGAFAAQIATGTPQSVRLTYSGKLADGNTNLVRNAALAGMLNRFLSQRANLVNAAQIAAARGWRIDEVRGARLQYADSVSVMLTTDCGESRVEGGVLHEAFPRLLSVDGIPVEAPLQGHLVFMKNQDVPGVIGRVGTILGANKINIANFSLGRRENHATPGEPTEAVAVVHIDESIPEPVLEQLRRSTGVRFACAVELD
ncbi:MAG TPA: phosphoglycerate dehydrogenase [Bryobacterales bacterium]|nr:phosphoglycerate dehydrogenase [Bryobacterales bacterium]